jgi:hypothetical protein
MIQRILGIVVVIYLVLVSGGVAIVYLLAPKIGFLGGLAASAAVFAVIAWGIIRVVAKRLQGVMAMVRMMQGGGMGMPGMGTPGAKRPTIDGEILNRGP